MNERELKFRIWVHIDKAFTYFDIYNYPSGIAMGVSHPMQFTGFKDSKDKDIFEGDILRWEEYQGWEVGITIEGIYVAQWDEERGQWMCYDPFHDDSLPMFDTRYSNIIGNVMENKSLLPCEGEVD